MPTEVSAAQTCEEPQFGGRMGRAVSHECLSPCGTVVAGEMMYVRRVIVDKTSII